ncbi:hypothetical protein PGT21_035753 [Puccinia graminis f. sp. tritici]|uniref:Uncharacterized protein n=1 Tax=Puccinia graminis f. sp. tritici TaxID=56615 RepID=A0A5B0NUP5_PUCGR|nr:hypothetical protein PGT21_035753 [Puccinia graminis f. sp. tritici]
MSLECFSVMANPEAASRVLPKLAECGSGAGVFPRSFWPVAPTRTTLRMVGTSAGPEEGRKSPVYNKEEFPRLTGEGVQSQTQGGWAVREKVWITASSKEDKEEVI